MFGSLYEWERSLRRTSPTIILIVGGVSVLVLFAVVGYCCAPPVERDDTPQENISTPEKETNNSANSETTDKKTKNSDKSPSQIRKRKSKAGKASNK